MSQQLSSSCWAPGRSERTGDDLASSNRTMLTVLYLQKHATTSDEAPALDDLSAHNKMSVRMVAGYQF